MKNRFIDLLIEKDRRKESQALLDSARLLDDPTKYNPFKDKPLDRTDKKDQ